MGITLVQERIENLRMEIAIEQKRLIDVFHKYGAMAVIFDDGQFIDNTDSPPPPVQKDEEYDLDWIKRQMDEEAWRKMSEQERQKLLAKMKLLERMLRKELYGSDWQRRLAQLRGDEDALRELEVWKILFKVDLK